MAQTGYTPISIYYSATATNTPTAGNLVAGELAINTADGKLFYKDSAGVVQVLGTKGGVGSSTTTQVLYNSSGLVVGSANMTFNGTTLTTANDASISGLTVGKGGGSVSNNTALGYQAGYSNTSGARNTFAGYGAGYSNTTGLANTFVGGPDATGGYSAGYSNTSGSYNVALGDGSLGANTTASNNTAVGYQAGYSNIIGVGLTFIGKQAGYLSTGNYNTALGLNSLYSNTTGSFNTALGDQALLYNTTASNNTAVGYQAGYSTTGISNTYVGYNAGYGVTSGTYNICLGVNAGKGVTPITTGSESVHIGYYTSGSSSSANSEMVIYSGTAGTTAKGASTGFINPNGGGVYQGNNSATWSITSDARLKKNIVDNTTGLDAITAIQVRNFEYRLPEEITEVAQDQAIKKTGVQLGAIAQELKEILPECVKTESTGVMSVDTTNLTWYLINAVKELNAKITALENK